MLIIISAKSTLGQLQTVLFIGFFLTFFFVAIPHYFLCVSVSEKLWRDISSTGSRAKHRLEMTTATALISMNSSGATVTGEPSACSRLVFPSQFHYKYLFPNKYLLNIITFNLSRLILDTGYSLNFTSSKK